MFDERLKHIFLTELRDTCNVTVACQRVGIATSTAYLHRREDPLFAERWGEALNEAVDLLEYEAQRRAFKGVDKPVFYLGEECGTITEYSDSLAKFLLESHRPHKYRANSRIELTGKDGNAIELSDTQRTAQISALLAAARKRREEDGSDLV